MLYCVYKILYPTQHRLDSVDSISIPNWHGNEARAVISLCKGIELIRHVQCR